MARQVDTTTTSSSKSDSLPSGETSIVEGGTRSSPTTSTGAVAAAAGDSFEARRTTRVSKDFAKADGDTWQETLAVCEAAGAKLMIRSYYLNTRTGKRVWDEPPTGASMIKPATEEMRRMANLQLQEMQIVAGTLPPEDTKQPERKKGLFRWKGAKSKAASDAAKPAKAAPRIQYKPNSMLAGRKPDRTALQDESMDPDIQKAIALSMGVQTQQQQQHEQGTEPTVYSEIWQEDDDEEVAMAKALSLSVAEASPPRDVVVVSTPDSLAVAASQSEEAKLRPSRPRQRTMEDEEALLARILEQSKLEEARRLACGEEEKCEENDEDLLGLHDESFALGHNFASNHSSRSSSRSSSRRNDDRKPAVAVTAASSPKRSPPRQRDSAWKHDAEMDEETMLQMALEESKRESERISKAQEHIQRASQRGSRTLSPRMRRTEPTATAASATTSSSGGGGPCGPEHTRKMKDTPGTAGARSKSPRLRTLQDEAGVV